MVMAQSLSHKFKVISECDGGECATVELTDEDHTLGNALRYMIVKNSDVQFCGYSLPHPNERRCLMQIQMVKGRQLRAIDAFERGLRDLLEVSLHIKSVFTDAVQLYYAPREAQ